MESPPLSRNEIADNLRRDLQEDERKVLEDRVNTIWARENTRRGIVGITGGIISFMASDYFIGKPLESFLLSSWKKDDDKDLKNKEEKDTSFKVSSSAKKKRRQYAALSRWSLNTAAGILGGGLLVAIASYFYKAPVLD